MPASGHITALNPALEHMLGERSTTGRSLCLGDLIHPEDKPVGERFMREPFEGKCDSFQLVSRSFAPNGQAPKWTAWRVSGIDGKPDYALALAEEIPHNLETEHRFRQAQRLETVGRLVGVVAHDFNNLLTGVLLPLAPETAPDPRPANKTFQEMKEGNFHSLQRNQYNDVSRFQSEQEKVLSDDALKALMAYDWR
jgi:hypothetical protein